MSILKIKDAQGNWKEIPAISGSGGGDTTELQKEISDVKEDLSHKAEAEDLATANRKIKAMYDVMNGIDLKFETTEYNSAKVDVPSGAVADSILKIGGHSKVSKNLINIFDANESTANGITFSRKSGVIKMKGTSTKGFNLDFSISPISIKGNTDYVLSRNNTSAYPSNIWFSLNNDNNAMVSKSNITKIVRLETDRVYDTVHVWIDSGVTIDLELTLMLEKGTVATDYEPYFEGIVSSQTDAIEIMGKNLFDDSIIYSLTMSNTVKIKKEGHSIKFSGTANGYYGVADYYTGKPIIKSGETVTVSCINTSYPNGRVSFRLRNDATKEYKDFVANNVTWTATFDVDWFQLCSTNNGVVDYEIRDIMIVRGTEATPYKPYSLQNIPTNLPVLRSAGTVYDYIERGVTFKDMKSVDLGSITTFRYLPVSSSLPYGAFQLFPIQNSAGYDKNGICSAYPRGGLSTDKSFILGSGNDIYIIDSSYTDATSFKEAMQGVILHYEAVEGGEDYSCDVLHQRVGSVYLDEIDYGYNSDGKYFNGVLPNDANKSHTTWDNAFICSKYPYSRIVGVDGTDKTSCLSEGYFRIKDSAYTNASALKSSLSGETLNYELANERIRELPNLPSLEAINVESGGEITFVDHSELAMPIPTTHEWVVRNEEV